MKMLAEYKQKGKSFFIPVDVDENKNIIEFTTGMMPVNQHENEDGISDDEKAAYWFTVEAEKQRLNDENNFPSQTNNY